MISVYKDTVHDSYKLNLSELGLSFLEFNVQSLESDIQTEQNDSNDGEYTIHNQYLSRKINAKLYLRADNNIDFQNKKSGIYKLFNSKQKLLIVDDRLTIKKVWEVYTDSSYTIENNQTAHTSEIELVLTSESPFAQAIDETNTTITTQTGTLFNNSDIYLDARVHNIQFKFLGKSDKLRIVNETTKTQWQYKGKTELSDEIYIDSIYPYKNNVNVFGDTDYGVLEFAKGSNTIKLYGVTGDFSLNIKHYDLFI